MPGICSQGMRKMKEEEKKGGKGREGGRVEREEGKRGRESREGGRVERGGGGERKGE